jgi:hypothetical protein
LVAVQPTSFRPLQVAGRISYSDLVGISKNAETLPKPPQAPPVLHQNEATRSIQDLVAAFYNLGSSVDLKSAAPVAPGPVNDVGSEENAGPERYDSAQQGLTEALEKIVEESESEGGEEDGTPRETGSPVFGARPENTGRGDFVDDARSTQSGESDYERESQYESSMIASPVDSDDESSDDVGENSSQSHGSWSPKDSDSSDQSPVLAAGEVLSSELIHTAAETERSDGEITPHQGHVLPSEGPLAAAHARSEDALPQNPETLNPACFKTLKPVLSPEPLSCEDDDEVLLGDDEALSEAVLTSPMAAHSPERSGPIRGTGPRLSWSSTSPGESAEDPLKLWRAMAYPDGKD